MSNKPKRRAEHTIRDIAKMAGVSRSTVSLALNSSPRIKPETRDRVLALIKEVGYRPNKAARDLALRTARNILVILPQIDHIFSDSYFSESLSGILDVATRRSYHLMVEVATDLFKHENRALRIFQDHSIDGVLAVGNLTTDDYLLKLHESGCPVVLVNSCLGEIPGVTGANAQAAVRAVRHLNALGHRRIAHIRGSKEIWASNQRTEGYLTAVKELELPVDEGYVAQGFFGQRSGREAMKQLLAQRHQPTAVYCANDMMAIGALQAIQEAGLRIPEDIALVGGDDIQIARYVTPRLTTIQQSMYSIGEAACEHLLRYLDDSKIYKTQIEIGLHLIIRESCGSPISRSSLPPAA